MPFPWSWYADPEVLRREQERIFRRTWQYVGHAGSVENVGDRFSAWAGEVPVLVVRGEDGPRAFLNVCRHRGSLLVEGEGSGKSVQCPYHAWTYGLDGSLRAAPRSEREPDFDPDGLSLVPLRLETWGPFLFANPDEDAPPLVETLGPLPELLPLDGLVFHSRDEFEVAANWKIACENYLECYHCPVAHKGFSATYDVDPDEYRLEPIADHVLSQFAHTRDGEEGQAQFHFVWPNLRINVFAGAPNLSLGPLLPAGPERSSGVLDYFFAPDADPAWLDELLEFDRQVGAEDRVLV
ncbi:MAG TPA: aromatic ring-hydroxylating dioxygenase subunit alpha, partial [Gaiellaceae bacterium]|nr:aromatic ring-hydroxylating dioxygenase subunit alpha [Gaiellaceae bacterium]